jgi:hypothetical protein
MNPFDPLLREERRALMFGRFLDELGDASFRGRSAALRAEPCSTVSVLRAPPAIAKGAGNGR